jgi:D-alanyl-D-alanine carboxypeptidase
MPDDDVFVAILTNGSAGRDISPGNLALQMAGIAIGKPAMDPAAITLKTEQLERFVGNYVLEDKSNVTVSRDGDQLYMQGRGPRSAIKAVSETEFFVPGAFTRVFFQADASGRVTSLQIRPRAGMAEIAKRAEQAPQARVEIPVDSRILETYAGDYELAPNFILTVTVEDGKLMTQATGQQKVQVYAESETKFFLKVTDAQIEFVKDDSGAVTGLKLYQGGRILPAKKLQR